MPPVRPLLLTLLLLLIPAAAVAQSDPQPPPIDVVEVRGPIDELGAQFIIDSVNGAHADGAQAVILQIDSPGAVNDRILDAIALVSDPPLPVISWIGDAPATARGGALELALAGTLTLAAPGTEIGYSSPLVVGEPGAGTTDLVGLIAVEEAGDLVDGTEPALGPLIAALHGRELTVRDTTRRLDTTVEVSDESGNVRLQVAPQIRFHEPGLLARTTRMALQPEAIFFFLVAGLSFVAFEFYAIGPGIAAATAAVPLVLAGYGLVVLPVGWGLVVVLAAMWLLAADYQRGGFGILSYAATIGLALGGMFIVDSRPQIEPSIWSVIVITLGVMLFFMFAMPTVARSRFTTQTMGREYLVGRVGTAKSDASDGSLVVEVDGAAWQATTFRESTIVAGSSVEVQSVQGLYLEVVEADSEDPRDRENKSDDME